MTNMNNSTYLDFCKRILTDTVYDKYILDRFFESPNSVSEDEMLSVLQTPVDEKHLVGNHWPERAHTMVGLKRLDNLQFCIEDVLRNNVEGDMIETGVWRGGASIFMRLVLKKYGIKNKIIYVADSFMGLPEPDVDKYPLDRGDELYSVDYLKITIDEVKSNFKKYGILDEQVRFLKGWFKDSLRNPPFEKLSILRLDGDMYGSTWQVLENLYDKLSEGGFLIVDDYGLPGCRSAVNDFRLQNNITETIMPIDWTGVFWKKGSLKEESDNKLSLTSKSGQEAFGILLKRYNERPDLQQAFPQVRKGEYQELINWAANVVSKKWSDHDYEYLSLFKNWFLNYEAPIEKNEKLVSDILELTKFSSCNSLSNTVKSGDLSEHLPTLFFLTVEFNLKTILELGVGDGFSTMALAEAASHIGGRIWSIDLEECKTAKHRINELKLNNYWTFIQGNDLEIGKSWDKKIDHLFIDSAHYYAHTLAELNLYEKFVSETGFITFHDTYSFPGVLRAIRDFLKTTDHEYHFYNYNNNNGFAVLRRIR